jgi:hypothetical protein
MKLYYTTVTGLYALVFCVGTVQPVDHGATELLQFHA